MDEETTQVDVDHTENHEDGNGTTTEGINKQDDQEKDWAKIAQDQKIRAEKAEARLKALSGDTKNKPESTFDAEAIRKEAEQAAIKAIEQRELQSLNYPDEIKDEIKFVMERKGLTVRDAEQNPYIQSLVAEHQRAERVANASAASSGGSMAYKFDPNTPPDVDVSTEDGQKAIEQWERDLERHNSQK